MNSNIIGVTSNENVSPRVALRVHTRSARTGAGA
jgi:hypothetical protein